MIDYNNEKSVTMVQWLHCRLTARRPWVQFPGQGISVRCLHVLPVPAWAHSGYSSHSPKTCKLRVRIIGHSKIACRCECERGWLFVSICQLVRSWNMLQPATPTKNGKWTNGRQLEEAVRDVLMLHYFIQHFISKSSKFKLSIWKHYNVW